jgi:putative ATP-dependent endonuclease of the OLD family
MYIKKVNIENLKCFKGKFVLILDEGLNILVGDNEAGKSTILEAIHLVLTGLLNGRYLKNDLSQYLFNNDIVEDYVKALGKNKSAALPYILIEALITGDDLALFEGDGNSEKKKECGISLKIAFDDKYQAEYEELVKKGDIKTIPIEYYDVFWTSCARQNITAKSIPLKPALIDSSSNRYQNGSDIYISRIVRELLGPGEIIDISQAHRKMRESFRTDVAIQNINKKIKNASKISSKEVTLSVDLPSKNAWESSLMTYLDNVPFHHIGKGEQCIVKTKLALSHKKSKEANLLLLEEPESHLSHSKLNQLIRDIKDHYIEAKDEKKQIIISTHSSFVANKLGLDSIIFLNERKESRLKDLNPETKNFFEKISGYDTLRLILCKKAILVEGDSDELIVQKAYRINNSERLPIDDGIDVISVGTSFLRFLEIAEKINKKVVVVTDNDGDVIALKAKFKNYLDKNAKDFIKICFDDTEDTGVQIDGKQFNNNTLEPKLVRENGLKNINKILGTDYSDINDLHKYMKAHKTECALKMFNSSDSIKFPKYILSAIQ